MDQNKMWSVFWLIGLLTILSAGSVYPKEKGLLFSDDFSRGADEWEQISGTWEVENGEYVGNGEGLTTAGDEGWTDYVYEVRMKTDESGSQSWNVGIITFRFSDPDNWYFVLLHTNRTMELGKRFNGQHTPGLQNVSGVANPRQWNTIRIEVKKDNIKIYVNGKKKIDYTDPEPIENGKIGFWMNGNSVARFDDVRVWEYGKAPEMEKVEEKKEQPLKEKTKEEAVKPVVEQVELGEVFRDDFSGGPGNWEALGGDWEVRDGKYFAREEEGGNAISFATGAPDIDIGAFEAKAVIDERLTSEQWAFLGIIIGTDNSNFWLFALTEGPAKEHYVDFLENLEGRWQAQNEAETKLNATDEKDMGMKWEYRKEYKFRLELDPDGIMCKVIDPRNNNILAQRRWVFGDMTAVRMGKPGLISRGMSGYFKDIVVFGKKGKKTEGIKKGEEEMAGPKPAVKIEEGKEGRIALLRDNLPGTELSAVEQMANTLRTNGFGVTYLSADDICRDDILTRENFFLYIIPNSRYYPARGMEVLRKYVRSRGNLIVLGGPSFKNMLWKQKIGGKEQWLDRESFMQMLANIKPENIFLNFEDAEDFSDWQPATNEPGSGSLEPVSPGANRTGKCMKYEVSNLTGWTTFYSPPIEGMFPPGHNLLCFWAKGDEKTPMFIIEMNEQDGSRWIGVVKLTTEWKYYVMSPEEFIYWMDSPTKDKRGGPKDCFNPENATRINFGIAFSHTPMEGGQHTFWIDEVGTAKNPFGKFESGMSGLPLVIETISPSYKTYRTMEPAATVQVEQDQVIIDKNISFPVPSDFVCPVHRPRGSGYKNNRRLRWIPLVNCLDKNREERGTLISMLINNATPFKGSIFAGFGMNDQALYKDSALNSILAEVCRRIKEGLFLFEGGSQYFSYYPDEDVLLGAKVINWGEKDTELTVRITVFPAGKSEAIFKNEKRISVRSGQMEGIEFPWKLEKPRSDLYIVRTELLKEGKVIDMLTHEMGVLSTRKPSSDEFVVIKGDSFYIKDKKWYPVGINFWPLYISGTEPGEYHLGWLDPAYYEPNELEKDLERMNALGMTMVSIQMGAKQNLRNLLDFLRRCEKHNIRVNGFLQGASPVDFNEKIVREFITEGRLMDNTTLFCYDIIWEPGNWMFNSDGRKKWNKEWEKWVIERYGSIENAEKDWGFSIMSGRTVVSPTDQQMSQDGEYRRMVAAYRRFMDDFTSRKWNDARRRIKKYDPNHFIIFRQGNTLPHDFALTGPVKHIDFICPEGYSIQNSEDGYNASGFITRYVNFTTCGKPVYWAEFGMSVWDSQKMEPSVSAMKSQAQYHERFYRMVLEAGANGTAPWWWPGGYRVDEKSDFGIINPDGTFRPSAELIKKYSPLIQADRSFPRPDVWLTIDRDAHAGGYWHITFNEGKDEYKKAVSAKKNLGIRTAGTGTNSANTPLVAVGNTKYNGKNPPKYLNAEFNWIKIKDATGEWQEIFAGGMAIEVEKGKPVMVQASIGNLQEAEWLSPLLHPGAGSVYLSSREGDIKFSQPIPEDTPYLSDVEISEFKLCDGITKETKVVFELTALDRCWFGERWQITLVPK